jgi:hypothetical protein
MMLTTISEGEDEGVAGEPEGAEIGVQVTRIFVIQFATGIDSWIQIN